MPRVLAAILVWAALGSIVFTQAPPPDILISRQLAEAYNLRVGETVQLSPKQSGEDARAFTIRGIYEPTPNPEEINDSKFKARMHLPDVPVLSASPDDALAESVDSINVRLVDPAEAQAYSRDVMRRMPTVIAQPIQSAVGSASTFVVLERFHLAIALVTIFASTVFLLALSVMLVDERRETVGVLRLIGLTSRRVLVQIFLEGLLIAIGGSVFGLLLALGSQSLINHYFQWHYNTALIFVRVTPGIWLQCLLIAVPLGVIASVTASWALLRRQVMAVARR